MIHFLTHIPQPSTWSVDWAQVAGAVLSFVAVVLAGVSLVAVRRSDARQLRRLAEQRRTDFELSLLHDLAEAVELDWTHLEATARFQAAAATLGPSIVPLACAAAGLASTPEAEAQAAASRAANAGDSPLGPRTRSHMAPQIRAQVTAAIWQRIPHP